jgi:cytochrome c-type biogenesis protein
MIDFSLIPPAFLAGVLMFLAPCTLPLVPAFLGFISGVSLTGSGGKRKVIVNTLFYILGFSLVFIAFGVLAGVVGGALAPVRVWLTSIGGALVIFFGLYLLGVFKLRIFSGKLSQKIMASLRGRGPLASLVFGAAFSAGWTPCVGPVVGTILLLASTKATALGGGLLLAVFSLGLAIPFFLTALFIEKASRFVSRLENYLPIFEKITGVLIIILGILLLTNNLAILIPLGYKLFEFIDYERILELL